jgi:hypothetical protein
MQGGDEYIVLFRFVFYLAGANRNDLWRFLTLKNCICRDCYFYFNVNLENDILLISTPFLNYVKPTFQLIHIASLEQFDYF